MSNALKEYLSLSQTRVEKALEDRLPSEIVLPQKLQWDNILFFSVI